MMKILGSNFRNFPNCIGQFDSPMITFFDLKYPNQSEVELNCVSADVDRINTH